MSTLHDFKATSLAGQPVDLQSLKGIKFLVGRDGELIRRYPPKATPEDIAADIESVM